MTEHTMEFLSLKGGYTDSSESIHVKMPHYWKSHVTAQIVLVIISLAIGSLVTSPGVASNKSPGLHGTQH